MIQYLISLLVFFVDYRLCVHIEHIITRNVL
jgi:hypothetical protein